MKGLLVFAGLLLVASGAAYGFSDNFDSYQTGPLNVVSGGVWRTWGGTSTDAQVVTGGLSQPNAMEIGEYEPDVVTYWPNLFGGGGGAGRFSFDFLVHEELEKDMDTYVFAGSGNPADNSIDYGSSIGIFILDWWTDSPGFTKLHIWDVAGPGGGGDYGVLELGTNLALNTWHHVDLLAALTVPDPTSNNPADADGFFDVFLNGNRVAANVPFGLDNPMGWNATEIYGFKDDEIDRDYMLIDNVDAVPEPGSLLALGTGLLSLAGLAIRRRK